MATSPTINEREMPADQEAPASPALLVSLGPLTPAGLKAMLANLSEAFPQQRVLVAMPDPVPSEASAPPHLQLVSYSPQAQPVSSWLLSATDYLNAWKLAEEHHAAACLLLGPEAQSLSPT